MARRRWIPSLSVGNSSVGARLTQVLCKLNNAVTLRVQESYIVILVIMLVSGAATDADLLAINEDDTENVKRGGQCSRCAAVRSGAQTINLQRNAWYLEECGGTVFPAPCLALYGFKAENHQSFKASSQATC